MKLKLNHYQAISLLIAFGLLYFGYLNQVAMAIVLVNAIIEVAT